jgi:diguanylate cyclase (GGDEF)-like protein
MKSVFANEFRNLSDFLNYERVLVEKLFSLLSSFVEYSVAGIYFSSPDSYAEHILYLDTLGKNITKSMLSDIQYDFFRKMEEFKTINDAKFQVVRILMGKEMEYKFSDMKSSIVIPLVFDKKLIGGICFYALKEIDYASFRYFDIMISELLALFKIKYQYTEKEFMSVLDGLTGLYNRRQFELGLEQEYNRSKRHPSDFSLAILDIDFFKKVNDTYGHQYGDYVLQTVANIMKSCFRKTDLLYRYGGEELVIIMPETNIEGAIIPVQRLRRMVEDYTFEYNGVKAKVTVSIGLTMNFQEFGTPADMLKSADEALYKAKEGGRNRVVLHEQQ